MRRGDLYWVNLEPSTPPEFGKTRPAVIVSNSGQNQILQTVVVIPLSSQPPEIWPLRLALSMPGGKQSHAVLPGIRQVNKQRLFERIGAGKTDEITALDEALTAYLRD